MSIDLNQITTYCSSVAEEFNARLNRVRSFVGHNPTSGSANEEILRAFLSEHTSKRYTVAQGFIVDPFRENKSSRQCDILVFDGISCPVLHQEGGVRIVQPEAVKMVIEVKTTLKKGALEDALKNIKSARALNSSIAGFVFGFEGTQPKTLFSNLTAFCQKMTSDEAPLAILTLEPGFVATRDRDSLGLGGGVAGFSAYQFGSSQNTSIALTYLLLLYFDLQMRSVWGGASVANARRSLLEGSSHQHLGDISCSLGQT